MLQTEKEGFKRRLKGCSHEKDRKEWCMILRKRTDYRVTGFSMTDVHME